jgi:hypothetical protein
MRAWNESELREHFAAVVRAKQREVDQCRTEIRSGKHAYQHFLDEAFARTIVGTILQNNEALSDRQSMIAQLGVMQRQASAGVLDTTGLADVNAYRKAVNAYIDELIDRFDVGNIDDY